jgi:hypothetical protein
MPISTITFYFIFRNGVFPASASIDAHSRFIESNEPKVLVYNVTKAVTVHRGTKT